MSNISLLQALAFEPRQAFTELDARPRFWWPMLVLAIASALLAYWYTSFVDLEWLVDQQLRQSSFTANLTEEEIARLAQQTASQGGMRAAIGAVTTLIFVGLMLLVGALYYLLAGKVTGVDRSFRHWLAMSAWTSVPTAVAVIPSALVLLTATSNQLGQDALQPLSLNELFFKREAGQTGFLLLTNITLFNFVSLYLAAVGVKVWSGRSWLFSILFTALPLILIFGIWALFALR
jgi:hypothetical protein